MTAYDTAVLADSPLVYLKLDETSGTVAADSSGNGHNGTYSGGFTLGAEGLIPNTLCPSFDGVDGYVQTVESFESEFANVSFECLFRSAGHSSYAGVLTLSGSSVGGFAIQFNDQTFPTWPAAYAEDATGSTDVNADTQGADLDPDTTYHIIATYNGSDFVLYVNGQVYSSDTGSLVPAPNDAAPLAIGAQVNPFLGGFNGKISNIALYTTGLSAERVLAHYDAISEGGGNLYTPPIAYDYGPINPDTQGLQRLLFRHYSPHGRFQTVWKLNTNPITYSLTQPYPLITPDDVREGNTPINDITTATYLHVYYGPEQVDADEAARLIASGIGTVT